MPAPSVLPGRISQRVDRKSRLLFHWRAADLSLDPVTKETPTFVRATGGGLTRDVNGNLGDYAQYQPRFEMYDPVTAGVFDTPGLLIEGQRTNVALWNRDLTNAAWTKTNVTATKDQTGVDGVASSASKIVATLANGSCLQVVTLASSQRLQSAYVKRVTGSGTVNMTTDGGTTFTPITVTNAWTRVTIPAQTVLNPNFGFQIVTNGDAIAVDFVQNETGAVASSPIATTTAAVTRNADELEYPFLPSPQSMTIYAHFTNRGGETIPNGTILASQTSGATPRWFLWHQAATAGWQLRHDVSISVLSTTASFGAFGDRVELLGQFFSDGSVQLSQSINGGDITTAARSAANAFGAAWSRAILDVNVDLDGNNKGGYALHALKIAAGLLTMAQMREQF